MNYEETIKYLYNSVPMFQHVGASAYKEGLYNTLLLDEHFGHPHKQYKTIHVAGTNGKGSCSHTLAAILQAAGYKVGLYTSPHLIDFRERIKINGQCINKNYVINFVEQERSFFEPLHPSFFELTTAMAFKFFAEQKVDVAIIEVGLGGRLDCTNIIQPILSIITNISFDHTQFLGSTLGLIAGEKAGIIKNNVPVIIGEANDETKPVFVNKAKSVSAPIVFAEMNAQIKEYLISSNGGINYKTKDFEDLHGELGGIYQIKNTNTILNAIIQLRFIGALNISNDDVKKGFANVVSLTGLLGRWQQLQKTPKVVCDTGHNVGGWEYLSKQLSLQRCKKMRIVFGMVDDKDIHTVISLLPKDAIYYFTKPSTKRAINEDKVLMEGKKANLNGNAYLNVAEAYEQALKDSSEDDFIFVGGSSYIVSDLFNHLDASNKWNFPLHEYV